MIPVLWFTNKMTKTEILKSGSVCTLLTPNSIFPCVSNTSPTLLNIEKIPLGKPLLSPSSEIATIL